MPVPTHHRICTPGPGSANGTVMSRRQSDFPRRQQISLRNRPEQIVLKTTETYALRRNSWEAASYIVNCFLKKILKSSSPVGNTVCTATLKCWTNTNQSLPTSKWECNCIAIQARVQRGPSSLGWSLFVQGQSWLR